MKNIIKFNAPVALNLEEDFQYMGTYVKGKRGNTNNPELVTNGHIYSTEEDMVADAQSSINHLNKSFAKHADKLQRLKPLVNKLIRYGKKIYPMKKNGVGGTSRKGS